MKTILKLKKIHPGGYTKDKFDKKTFAGYFRYRYAKKSSKVFTYNKDEVFYWVCLSALEVLLKIEDAKAKIASEGAPPESASASASTDSKGSTQKPESKGSTPKPGSKGAKSGGAKTPAPPPAATTAAKPASQSGEPKIQNPFVMDLMSRLEIYVDVSSKFIQTMFLKTELIKRSANKLIAEEEGKRKIIVNKLNELYGLVPPKTPPKPDASDEKRLEALDKERYVHDTTYKKKFNDFMSKLGKIPPKKALKAAQIPETPKKFLIQFNEMENKFLLKRMQKTLKGKKLDLLCKLRDELGKISFSKKDEAKEFSRIQPDALSKLLAAGKTGTGKQPGAKPAKKGGATLKNITLAEKHLVYKSTGLQADKSESSKAAKSIAKCLLLVVKEELDKLEEVKKCAAGSNSPPGDVKAEEKPPAGNKASPAEKEKPPKVKKA